MNIKYRTKSPAQKIFSLLSASLLLALLFFILPRSTSAQNYSGQWYIKDFHSDIIINKDSSLDITETILADCPLCVDKHGIFRVLPQKYTMDSGEKVKTPINLTSITNKNSDPYNYKTINDFNGTITWKIGDPDQTISGEHSYIIKYQVKNALRATNPNFDELYWNLNGNFWDIPTLNFVSDIIFPGEISQNNTKLSLYSGEQGSKDNKLSQSSWIDNHTLKISSTKPLAINEGITVSATFPKGVITPYIPSFIERFGGWLWLLSPLLTFLICLTYWTKYGRDPKVKAGVVPEFGAPDNLTPLEMSAVISGGTPSTQAITAEIVNLAVKGIIKITEIPKQGILGKEDYQLDLISSAKKDLTIGQRELVEQLFSDALVSKQILLSELKDKFYLKISVIDDAVENSLKSKKLLMDNTSRFISVPISLTLAHFFGGFIAMFIFQSAVGVLVEILAILVAFPFIFLMFRRTKESEEMLFRIRGFKYYMTVAEKYRQKFNEKENIFERFLPYAIMFGITGLWIKKMNEIYGAKYFSSYHPLWYAGSISNFNVGSFTSELNSISSAVSSASSSPSSSGSGGGGSSGGGGGGGGGGGW